MPPNITGVILAGGRAQRMGGVDKGLQLWRGHPLIDAVIRRFAPQVSTVLISANRHIEDYAQRGYRVLPDLRPGYLGPLAGILTAMLHCRTPWLVTVPCDNPHLPHDLVAKLMRTLEYSGSTLAMAETQGKYQPVFSVLSVSLASRLSQAVEAGQYGACRWMLEQGASLAHFDDPATFVNANTLADLQAMEGNTDA